MLEFGNSYNHQKKLKKLIRIIRVDVGINSLDQGASQNLAIDLKHTFKKLLMILILNLSFDIFYEAGETSENSFSVDITDKIVVFNGTDNFQIDCDSIKVSHFKSLVFNEISYKLKSLNINSHNYLDLWRFNDTRVKSNESKHKELYTEDDIKSNLRGAIMKPNYFLHRYFIKDDIENNVIGEDGIHIIVQVW
ncbi:hypothetical protein C1646_672313 [Rhizophagus diaphanus]|nr:hypothetical protein C1646_672313 [Rhizophagus diaphanus] [Rhizophagus sp. MUCL 43196]